jgi:hypothetical protein
MIAQARVNFNLNYTLRQSAAAMTTRAPHPPRPRWRFIGVHA